MKLRLNFFLLPSLILSIMVLPAIAVAEDRVAAAIDSLPSIQKIDQVAISPDGTQVAYIVEGELSIADSSIGASHRIAPEQNVTRDVTWSADSRHIAWLSDLPGEKPAAQLWTAAAGA